MERRSMSCEASFVPRPMRTRPVTGPQARAYVTKATEYAEAAASEFEAKRYIAATSLAIHAAINAADAVCGARVGQRAAGEDHDHVLTLLKQAGPDGANIEKELRRILPLKTRTEYESDDVAPGVASKAVERAQRCVATAQAVVASSR
jgi:HEPN domain-containing protein